MPEGASPRFRYSSPKTQLMLRPRLTSLPAGALLLLAIAVLQSSSLASQRSHATMLPKDEIVVGTREVPPFVRKADSGELTGFSIDLWRAIAADLGLKSRFELHDTLPGLLDAVRAGNHPVGISAISITGERAGTLEFSQPMFRSGLGIMVRTDGDGIDILGMLFSRTMLLVLGLLALIILVPAHIFWWIARGRDEGLPIREAYFPGIFDALFWCGESMGGAPQGYPRRVFPRVVALVWLYSGMLFVSYFTAFATTTLTVSTLQGSIRGPNDLAGKRVAVVLGSTGASHIAAGKARPLPFADFAASAAALLNGTVDAVVYDAPVIQHYALREGRVRMAGVAFRPENYGIIFPAGSDLRRPVDQALLKLIENGTYDRLLKTWLGSAESTARAGL
jgi:polar amino acid transport system substrate-binding protein